jgi:hypothetical protein
MPHQCTDCGRAFDDGSTEMLSGCPDCGGTTFQYRPEGSPAPDPEAEPPDPPDAPAEGSVARTVGNAATAVRDLVGGGPASTDRPDGDGSPTGASSTGAEDAAQASARSEVVGPDDLPPAPESAETADRQSAESAGPDEGDAADERPDLRTLRAELNDQFESIRVVEPGQYELNLMELYDREEYIIALREDGKYTIQVPERWND